MLPSNAISSALRASIEHNTPRHLLDHHLYVCKSGLRIARMLLKLCSSQSADRDRIVNISNLRALRLFNDVDIRPAPSPPPGTKRISPPKPLIDQGGWQEIYSGKNLWIYDLRSNTDECVRVVSQAGDFYGTAS